MITESRKVKILLLILIAMLSLSIAAITSRAEDKSARYTGTYDTLDIRTLWSSCFNAAVSKRAHPAAATTYCDCFTDNIREQHAKLELNDVTGKAERFKGYANSCGIKLFSALTPIAEDLTRVRRYPLGSNRWLDALFISHYITTLARRRVQRGGS